MIAEADRGEQWKREKSGHRHRWLRAGDAWSLRRRDVCRTRADGVRAALVSRPSPAGGYFVRGLAADVGFDALLPLLAASAVFATAPAGAGWCALSPPFDMNLTPFP